MNRDDQSTGSQSMAAVHRWVADHSLTISSLDPETPDDDLLGVVDIIGSARIVGLGESTHGTREFSLLKDRIIRMLIRRAGFRVVALERDVPLAWQIGRYVAGEQADPQDVFSVLNTYPWQTEEFRGCVEWLRAWNARSREAVAFVGFDVQAPDEALEALSSSPDVEYLRELLVRTRGSDSSQTEWTELAQVATDAARKESDPYDSLLLSSIARFAEMKLAALTADDPVMAGYLARERAMADIIRTIAERMHPNDRILLWAHNCHVGLYEGGMGGHLRDAFGDAYAAIGFVFDHGTYAGATASEEQIDRVLRPFAAGSPERGSAEELLRVDGKPSYFLDLRQADVPDEFHRDRPLRQIGFIGGLETQAQEPLGLTFDAVVYSYEGSAAIPLSWSEAEITARQVKPSQ